MALGERAASARRSGSTPFADGLFLLQTVADMGGTSISNANNFYRFDRQRAQDEAGYRHALKQELQSYGDDVNRAGGLHRSN